MVPAGFGDEAEIASADEADLVSTSGEGAEDGVREQEHVHAEGLALGAQSGGSERSSQAPNSGTDPAGDETLIEQALRRHEAKRAAAGIVVEPPLPTSPASPLHRGTQRELSGTQKGTQEEPREFQGSQDTQGNANGAADRALSSGGWSVKVSETELQEALRRCRLEIENLEEFILGAVDRNNEIFELEHSEAKSKAYGKSYRSPTWPLASILKGHPDLADLENWEAVRIVDDVLEPIGGWDLLPDHDVFDVKCDPRDAFIAAWDAVREPLRCDPPPGQALPLVERWPLESDRWPSPRDRPYRRLVSLCYWYAVLLDDDGEFYLSSRDAGKLSGFSHKTAADYLRRATRDGLLELRQKGTLRGGKASEYRFVLEAVVVEGAEKSVEA